ncbi:MAG: hypothetical protein M3R58_01175 [Pseudomonadota bacterium]|nr:hypothetical protein [Pseudomonadota bacterium]
MKKTRDEYVKSLKDQLDRWNSDVSKWESQAKVAQADMKKRYEPQLAALREQREKAAYQMKLLEGASATAWSEFTKGADEALDRMREAVTKARSHFDKK